MKRLNFLSRERLYNIRFIVMYISRYSIVSFLVDHGDQYYLLLWTSETSFLLDPKPSSHREEVRQSSTVNTLFLWDSLYRCTHSDRHNVTYYTSPLLLDTHQSTDPHSFGIPPCFRPSLLYRVTKNIYGTTLERITVTPWEPPRKFVSFHSVMRIEKYRHPIINVGTSVNV